MTAPLPNFPMPQWAVYADNDYRCTVVAWSKGDAQAQAEQIVGTTIAIVTVDRIPF